MFKYLPINRLYLIMLLALLTISCLISNMAEAFSFSYNTAPKYAIAASKLDTNVKRYTPHTSSVVINDINSPEQYFSDYQKQREEILGVDNVMKGYIAATIGVKNFDDIIRSNGTVSISVNYKQEREINIYFANTKYFFREKMLVSIEKQ